jgi:hypothetical protein
MKEKIEKRNSVSLSVGSNPTSRLVAGIVLAILYEKLK